MAAQIFSNSEDFFDRDSFFTFSSKTELDKPTYVEEKQKIEQQVKIMNAVSSNDLTALEDLVRNPEDLHFRDSFGLATPSFQFQLMSPLQLAASQNNQVMVDALIKRGASVSRSISGESSLIEWARINKVRPLIIDILCNAALYEIFKEAEFNFNGFDNCFKLAFLGDIEALKKEKINFQLKINAEGPKGINVVMAAVLGGNLNTVQYIITSFIGNIAELIIPLVSFQNGWNILQIAALRGYITSFDYFYPENPDLLRTYAPSILEAAFNSKNVAMIGHLINLFPEIIYEKLTVNASSLMCAAALGSEKIFDLILEKDQMLVDSPKKKQIKDLLECENTLGLTVLHLAVARKNIKIMSKILQARPNLLYQINKAGHSVLMYAVQNTLNSETTEHIEFLLKQDKSSDYKLLMTASRLNYYAHHFAVEKGSLAIFKILLRAAPYKKIFLSVDLTRKLNILQFAITLGHLNIVQFLLENCDPDKDLLHSKTPHSSSLLLCSTAVNFEIFKYLFDFVKVHDRDQLTAKRADGKNLLLYSVTLFLEGPFKFIFHAGRIEIVDYILNFDPSIIFQVDANGKSVFDQLAETYKAIPQLNARFERLSAKDKQDLMSPVLVFEKLSRLIANHCIRLFNKINPDLDSYSRSLEEIDLIKAQQLMQKKLADIKKEQQTAREIQLKIQQENAKSLAIRLKDLEEENKCLLESLSLSDTAVPTAVPIVPGVVPGTSGSVKSINGKRTREDAGFLDLSLESAKETRISDEAKARARARERARA